MILDAVLGSLKMSQKHVKRKNKKLKESQMSSNIKQKQPNATKREPKGTQKGAKRRQKWGNGSPKGPFGVRWGAKSEPEGHQNASKNWPSEKVAKMMPKGSAKGGGARSCDTPFWEPFSIKNRWKIDAEIDAEKVRKIEEKAKTDLHFDDFRNCFSWKIEFSEKGACTETTWFMQ